MLQLISVGMLVVGGSLFGWFLYLLVERRRERVEHVRALVENDDAQRAILDGMTHGVITIDERGIIDAYNPAAEVIFGWSASEMRGQSLNRLMPPEVAAEHDAHFERYVTNGVAKGMGKGGLREFVGRRKDGSAIAVEIAIAEVMIGDQKRFLGVVRDIREELLLRRSLEQAQKMETVGQITGGLAHDFNNLLQAVLGNLEMIKDEVAELPNALLYSELALKAGVRAADLTGRLLAFSRQQVLQPAPCDVNDLVQESVELISRTLAMNLEIKTVLAARLWPAQIDPSQLESALLNLAVNARDAMPGGGKLTFETSNTVLSEEYAEAHSEVTPGQYVMVSVSDTGTGISPDIIDRVSDPFFTTKGPSKGSGLGLSMVYGFMKQSGGHMHIESELGEGTSVRLYLPKVLDMGSGADLASQDQAASDPEPGDVPQTNILLIEDDPDVRTFLRATLLADGHVLHDASTASEGIELAERLQHIDLLITDIVLPGEINGRAAAEKIREIFPDCAVILISGYTEDATVHQGRTDADVDFLSKPFTRDALRQRIVSSLKHD